MVDWLIDASIVSCYLLIYWTDDWSSDWLIDWLIYWLIDLGSDSPKKAGLPDKVPAPALNGDAQLKYENDRLKLALAQSSANAKVLTKV